MTQDPVKAVEAAIDSLTDRYLDVSLKASGAVRRIMVEGERAIIDLAFAYPAEGIRDELEQQITERVCAQTPIREIDLHITWEIPSQPVASGRQGVPGVKNIIAVASAKGGVGKSTTAVNVALALAKEGARVGLLDADIYGPSQGLMLGVPEGRRPEVREDKTLMPIKAHGIKAMSMSFMITENTPMVWRGPMVSSALQQLLQLTAWDDCDYLIVDMPPGTGDIQLTLSQKVPVTGAVIVTTPQDLAVLDAKKGIEMFRKVDIPVVGIIENMSVFVCPECGHKVHLFGKGGGERLAAEYGTKVLGSLPLLMEIREQADSGNPSVAADPTGKVSLMYREIARRLGAELARRSATDTPGPRIVVEDD